MPHCRRFLGVNSVTNIEPGKGDLPVPIIRNEHWFEKFSFLHSTVHWDLTHQLSVTGEKDLRKRLECAGFPTIEHSGYAA